MKKAMLGWLTLLCLLFSACGGGEEATPDADTAAQPTEATEATAGTEDTEVTEESQEPESAAGTEACPEPGSITTINVGDIRIASQTDAYAAQELGFFEERGLEVNFTYANSGQDIVTALESGQLDVGLAIPGVVMVANAQGFDLVGLVQDQTAHDTPPDTGAILVSPDSDIQALSDLEGTSVAIAATGANQVYVQVTDVLEDAGVDVSQVNFQEIPFPQMGPVLQQGQVDAVVQVDPFTTSMQVSGTGRPISWFYVESIPGVPLSTYWAKRSWVDENPCLAEAYRAAMVESVEYLRDNPDEARDLIAEFVGLDRALLNEMPLIEWRHEVDPQVWEELGQLYVEQGLLDSPIELESLLTEGALQTRDAGSS